MSIFQLQKLDVLHRLGQDGALAEVAGQLEALEAVVGGRDLGGRVIAHRAAFSGQGPETGQGVLQLQEAVVEPVTVPLFDDVVG